MLSLLKNLVVLVILLIGSPVWADKNRAQYVPDLVVTEPGAIFTDMRAWGTNNAAFGDALSDIGTTPTTLVISEDVTITDVQLVESNTTLKFVNGAKIILTDSATLSILGTIDAGRHQIFQDNATISSADTTLGFTELQRGLVTFSNSTYIPVDGETAAYISTAGNNLQDYVYPEWWGAVHDDATSDRDAIQNALDSGVKTIELFASATPYRLNASDAALTFNSNDITLRGTGAGGTVIKPEINSINYDQSILYAIGKSRITIENISLNYSYNLAGSDETAYAASVVISNPGGSGGGAISLIGCHNANITNVHIRQGYVGIRLTNTSSVIMRNITAGWCEYSSLFIEALSAGGSTDIVLDGFIFNNHEESNAGVGGSGTQNDQGGTGGAIRLWTTDETDHDEEEPTANIASVIHSFFASNGDIVKSYRSMVVLSANGNLGRVDSDPDDYFFMAAGHSFFNNVVFDSSYDDSVYIDGMANTVFSNCYFNTGVSASGAAISATPTSNAVGIVNSYKLIFDNCVVPTAAGNGFYLAVDAVATTISDSIITSIGTLAAANTGSGIFVAPNTQNFIFTGNTIIPGYGAGNDVDYGIYIAPGTSQNFIITGNYLKGVDIAGVYDGGTGNVKIIKDNVIDLADVTASTTTIIPSTGNLFKIIGGTTITNLYVAGGSFAIPNGREVTLLFAAALTFTDGGNLYLNGNFATGAGDTITLIGYDEIWYEVSRSNN